MEACLHLWIIEPAAGPRSLGICAIPGCDAQRMFSNRLPKRKSYQDWLADAEDGSYIDNDDSDDFN